MLGCVTIVACCCLTICCDFGLLCSRCGFGLWLPYVCFVNGCFAGVMVYRFLLVGMLLGLLVVCCLSFCCFGFGCVGLLACLMWAYVLSVGWVCFAVC